MALSDDQLAEYRQQCEACHNHFGLLLVDEIDSLKRLHAVTQAFYDLTVTERNLERRKVDRLTAELNKLMGMTDGAD